MFKSKQANLNGNTTLIGRGARFTGTLEIEGSVHIEGQCEGTIRAQSQLSIGPNGTATGELSGSTVVIAGRVEGTVSAKETLHVLKTGSLRGEVFYGQLQVDSGGVIDGRTHQGPLPAQLAAGSAPQVAPELPDGLEEQSHIIDTRPKLSSFAPPAARSNAPGKR